MIEQWRAQAHSRTPRHFQQHELPGMFGHGAPLADSGVYLALDESSVPPATTAA